MAINLRSGYAEGVTLDVVGSPIELSAEKESEYSVRTEHHEVASLVFAYVFSLKRR
jgi:hypothetical protein